MNKEFYIKKSDMSIRPVARNILCHQTMYFLMGPCAMMGGHAEESMASESYGMGVMP